MNVHPNDDQAFDRDFSINNKSPIEEVSQGIVMEMDEKFLAPCGSYCRTCEFLNKKEKPSCIGCGNQGGQVFWGECKLYACAKSKEVDHCGDCQDFLCDLFVGQFDPAQGQESVFTRAGLLVYRKKFGSEKFIEIVRKIEEEKHK